MRTDCRLTVSRGEGMHNSQLYTPQPPPENTPWIHPPVNTDAPENIALPHTTYAVGNNQRNRSMSGVCRQCELLQLIHICEQRSKNCMEGFASHFITQKEKSFEQTYKYLGPKLCLPIA